MTLPAPAPIPVEDDPNFRPLLLKDFIGQEPAKAMLGLMLEGFRKRRELDANLSLDHLLFVGPPGLGKTTLARVVANELGVNCLTRVGKAFQRPGDLVSVLVTLKRGDVFFIDEIHELVQLFTVLYEAMEDFELTIPAAKTGGTPTRLKLPRFTLIGATTEPSQLSQPLQDRFGKPITLRPYSQEELELIAERDAGLMGYLIDYGATRLIASRARGTPRLLLYWLKRSRDLAAARSTEITEEIADEALSVMEVDESGLDDNDRRYLTALATINAGRPVGIKVLAADIGLPVESVEKLIEPYLIQKRYIVRTHGGRLLTRTGRAYILPHLKKAGLLSDAEWIETLASDVPQAEQERIS